MIKRFLFNQKVAPYIFVLPFILIFSVFFLYPMISTMVMSFQKILPGQVTFIGFKNYQRLFNDKIFFQAVGLSFRYMLVTCIILIPIPMMFACMINSKKMLVPTLFKALMYLPALTSVVVAGTIFRLAFMETPNSLANLVVQKFGINPVEWLQNPTTGFIVLVTLCCWRWSGVNMMYFLSGLKSIPEELYESADIDGANVSQKFLRITLPMLKPTSIYVLTISIYAGLAMFTESFMLWKGNNSPQNMGLTIVGYLYRQGVESNNFGYGSAVGIVLLAIAMTFNIVQLNVNGLFKKEDK